MVRSTTVAVACATLTGIAGIDFDSTACTSVRTLVAAGSLTVIEPLLVVSPLSMADAPGLHPVWAIAELFMLWRSSV